MCDMCRHKRIKCLWKADEDESERGSSPGLPKAGAVAQARRGARRKKPAAKVIEGEGKVPGQEAVNVAEARSVTSAQASTTAGGKGAAATEGTSSLLSRIEWY